MVDQQSEAEQIIKDLEIRRRGLEGQLTEVNSRRARAGSLTSALLATITGVAAVSISVWAPRRDLTHAESNAPDQLAKLTAKIALMSRDVTDLKADLKRVASHSGPSQLQLQTQQLNRSVARLQVQMSGLNNAILKSPEKSLELPLLRRDLDNLKDNHTKEVISLRQEVEHVYDQNKWFIALLIPMALGMVTLAYSSLITKPSIPAAARDDNVASASITPKTEPGTPL